MDFPLNQKWVVQLDGDILLTLSFKIQSKMTKVVIRMVKSKSYVTFGGKNPKNRFLENYNSYIYEIINTFFTKLFFKVTKE